jgi:RNA-directed DNA polymerase
MQTSLQGIAEKAKSQEKYRFRNRYGRLNEALLRDCWRDIRKDAAYGVDEVSAAAYAQDLDEHISNLVERLKRKSSRAKLVRRHYIPKGDGKLRPLGIPAVEDKRLQLAVTRILTAIYEQDFLRCSDGYRPHIGALDAVDTLTIKRQFGRDNWVVEADIQGFFDAIDHAWMIRMVAERIDDRALLRLIKKWLKAGILDTDGKVRHPVTGTPQGGTVSPILANVDLHYALDLWCERVVKQPCRGEACLIRYADDFVCACERQPEAERFYTMLGQRLGTCGLARSAEKTRVMPCSRQPPAPKTSFAFLGFECRWDKDRAGQDHITRRTARKKLRNSLKRFTPWCREHRNLRLGVLLARLHAKLRGYYNDYGVPGNFAGLKPFFSQALRILKKWLNRRSQRRSYNWAGYNELRAHFNIERPRIFGRPQTRVAASKA